MSSLLEKDPLDGLGHQAESFYKLERVIFAETINAKKNEETEISLTHNEFTFMDKITVEKRSGKRNKYHIEIDNIAAPRCPQSTCNREFSSLCLLRSHIRRVHCAELSYVCEQCGARFTAKYLLERHARTHGEKVECPVCLKMLSKRTSLSVHLRSHSNIRAHKCLRCGKCFVRKCTLNVHMRIHRDLKCGKCGKCGVHCAELSYVCEQCGARFTAKYLLERHARTHGEKVECPVCLKMLSKRTSLSVHLRSHSNIRAHKCLRCGKCFVRKCTLNVHMRIHRDLKCGKCGKCGFSNRSQLAKHVCSDRT